MSAARLHLSASRRGSVLVMVVAVLAMLFIVGSTQLMMARFERRLAEEKTIGTQTKETAKSAIVPPGVNVGEDARGVDGVAYNRSWNPAETSLVEDAADFPGVAYPSTYPGNPSSATEALQSVRQASRSGDLLLASLEPFLNGGFWTYSAMSWSKDAITNENGDYVSDTSGNVLYYKLDGSGNPTPATSADGFPIPLLQANEWPMVIPGWANPLTISGPLLSHPTITGVYYADVDGDGIVDGQRIGSMAGCDLYQRIISNGGMVTMDRMTHPALLAQVIHPRDNHGQGQNYQSEPWTLFSSTGWNGTYNYEKGLWENNDSVKKADEALLRRRFMLPGSTVFNNEGGSDWMKLPVGDLRKLLPYTLGYLTPDSRFAVKDKSGKETPHYWRVGTPPDGVSVAADAELSWWQNRIAPTLAPTEATPAQNQANMYDRRHLLTTHNSDDLLRPNRDEKGGTVLTTPAYPRMFNTDATTTLEAPARALYYILNPESDAAVDATLKDDAGLSVSISKQPTAAYGMVTPDNGVTWSLKFNKPGLRTPFSLRDVLDNATGKGTFARAMQLTAYYMAMLQNTTTTAGMSSQNQMRMAAQLAVNTIDYADGDFIPTRFAYFRPTQPPQPAPPSTEANPEFEVVGIEKQPYITEAYAKMVQWYNPGPPAKVETYASECLFAVEIYNPYNATLDLSKYKLNGNTIDTTLKHPNDSAWDATIQPYSYLVFVNQTADLSGNAGGTGKNRPFDPYDASRVVVMSNLKLSTDAAIGGLDYAKLERMTDDMQVLSNDLAGTYVPPSTIVVDQIGPENLDNITLGAIPQLAPDGSPTTKTVRHTSLQRHKEKDPANPIQWHFTMALQKGFESAPPTGSTVPAGCDPNVFTPNDYHGLLNADGSSTSFPDSDDDNVSETSLLCQDSDTAACKPATSDRFYNVPPMPIIVADSGLDTTTTGSTTGCAAFPTTGSLLLVTRNGHLSYDGVDPRKLSKPLQPLSVSSVADTSTLMKLDHGHMPVWDGLHVCKDIQPDPRFNDMPQGRFDVPWGQMVFTYFTALPLEELTLATFLNATDEVTYENKYIQWYGNSALSYSLYPMVERVTDASSIYGPRVRGRININIAPWWVLDGLPVLPDVVPTAGNKPVTMLPVQELQSGQIDRSDATAFPVNVNSSTIVQAGQRPGRLMSYLLTEKTQLSTTTTVTTISPTLARYMVSYREKRPVNLPGVTELMALASPEPDYVQNPGYVTPGAICNIIPRLPLLGSVQGGSGPTLLSPMVVGDLRVAPQPDLLGSTPAYMLSRPFAYLGYLQMIAPIVRLQDWVTTKSHVYTVYNLVTDNNGTWLRSQTTIDRTRCLYTNDLPDKITSIDPINYFNVMGDQ